MTFDNPSLPAAPINRRISLRTVMDALLHQGPISRADIAKVTGLSKQTSSEVVRMLEEGGWIQSIGNTKGAVGRSAVLYELRRDRGMVVGVDLGSNKLHAALVNLAGDVVAEELAVTDAQGGMQVLQQVAELVTKLANRSKPADATLLTVAVGCPGALDPTSGSIRFAPNIPGLDKIDALGTLKKALNCPSLTIENDVNLGVLGEQWYGAAAGSDDLVYAALGVGVGLGLLVNGKLARGAHGAAGEIAFLPIGPDPFSPGSLSTGTLEQEIGSPGILRRHAAAGGEEKSVRDIFDAALQGSSIAKATIDETGRLLALGLAAVTALLDPAVIVLGGSIGVRPELLEPVRRYLAACTPLPPPVEPSRLGTRATLMGAAASALHRAHNELFGALDLGVALSLPRPSL
ncbi:ROK family transcriptional regulator [Acidisoma cellulosilytica]|uniref:ROK family transcriptional regulator n=1 Tax=Acidisoma cellulosilyticum TaxID=2802395 RepID=A0A963Z237_9PROT|nr:ROK family transcriptional regulator [Acidisoma cellulosilyticum]MCB8881437.1 ROK family transcriptional regulator [Acidisoma cellulosilyticum]